MVGAVNSGLELGVKIAVRDKVGIGIGVRIRVRPILRVMTGAGQ